MCSNSRATVSEASEGFVYTSSNASGHMRNGFAVDIDCFLLGVLCGDGGKLRDWPDDSKAPIASTQNKYQYNQLVLHTWNH